MSAASAASLLLQESGEREEFPPTYNIGLESYRWGHCGCGKKHDDSFKMWYVILKIKSAWDVNPCSREGWVGLFKK